MAFFNFKERKVYYEIHGEGEPLLILNGIMMSTMSWKLFLPSFTEKNQVILVDFLDQGQSEKLEGESYKQDVQVELLVSLLNHLKIDRVNIVGISYGGEVALQFAVAYQNRIKRLVLFNATSYTSPWLHDIGRGWIKTAETYNPEAFYKVTIPLIYSPAFYTTQIEWMRNREKLLHQVFNKSFLDAMIRLIESAEGYDVRNQLSEIKVPTLIVGAEQDYMTPKEEQIYINQHIDQSELVIIPNCGHASMYERPALFISLVLGYINADIHVSIL